MAEYICVKDCQEIIRGKITFVPRGAVVHSEEPLKKSCFIAADSDEYVLDFMTATEAELLSAKWKPQEAIDWADEEFGAVLKKEKKADMVNAIIDVRYRNADI